jgi:hypothetical protein
MKDPIDPLRDVKRLPGVGDQQAEGGAGLRRVEIFAATGEEIVDADDLEAVGEEAISQVTTDESSGACQDDATGTAVFRALARMAP